MAAATIGYFGGKVSYVSNCQQKFLQRLPNSQISQNIRKARGLPQPELSDPIQSQGSDVFVSASEQQLQQQQPEADQSKMSYDLLREQHRERERQKYQRPSLAPPPPSTYPSAPMDSSPPPMPLPDEAVPKIQRRGPTNKYGDEGFE